MTRVCPPAVEDRFRLLKNHPSDINEHMEILRDLASRCDHVTEFGMRGGVSTVALLAGQPEKLISWDIDAAAVISTGMQLVTLGCDEVDGILRWPGKIGRTVFEPRCGSTLDVEIEPTEMLFIDTLHTYKHLKAELARHCLPKDDGSNTVFKYIAFHDTMTFAWKGEDGTEPGLRTAILWFQKSAWPLWGVKYDWSNNNGLVVLERVDVSKNSGVNPDPGYPQFK